VGTEITPHRGYFLSQYERSKTVAERLVLDRSDEIDVVSVNPSSVQGPGRSTGTGAIFLAAARGNLRFVIDATVSLVDIDDCARGHLAAASQGRTGQRYILSGPVVTVREAVRMLNKHLGHRIAPWFVQPRAVTAIAPIVDAAFRIAGRRSLLCAESARVLLHGHRYDASRSSEELGLEYTSLDDTLVRTLEWFRSEGLAKEG
jgi:dihydroflavonol-4-reductase